MELGLSLGEVSTRPFFLSEKGTKNSSGCLGLEFCMALGIGVGRREEEDKVAETETWREGTVGREDGEERGSADPPVQLELLPFLPVPRQPSSYVGFPWPAENGNSEASNRGLDVNRMPLAEEMEEGVALSSSPNSTVSSFQMDLSAYRSAGRGGGGSRNEAEAERASSRGSDEEENGLARKKLRLSKEQSAYLEESFKDHSTLNPKQKLALAKRLNLRPRQVEVWFQNRRARTKLKQTEVDCDYLKRCCEKLTEENRRLQKEVQELRALKTAHPFYMQLPATTLTMCPSCERVAATKTTTSSAAPPPTDHHHGTATATNNNNNGKTTSTTNPSGFPSIAAARPCFYPFAAQQPSHQASAA